MLAATVLLRGPYTPYAETSPVLALGAFFFQIFGDFLYLGSRVVSTI